MQKIYSFCARAWVMAVALLAVVACNVGFFQLFEALGIDILDVSFGYDRALVEQRMTAYGADGRMLYARAALSLDMVYPLAYAILYCGILTRLASRKTLPDFVSLAPFLPLAMALVDVAENLQIFRLLLGYPHLSDNAITAASATTQGKWVLATLMLTAFFMLAVWRLVDWMRRR